MSHLIRLVRHLGRLRHAQDGQVAVIFALALLPMVSAVGAAVDYSQANVVKTKLQASLDAALLAGAKDASINWQNIATDAFYSNVTSKAAIVGAPALTLKSAVYSGVANASVPTKFMGLVGVHTMAVTVRASVGGSLSAGACAA